MDAIFQKKHPVCGVFFLWSRRDTDVRSDYRRRRTLRIVRRHRDEKRGMNPLVIEKGCLVNSIYHFPTHMEFFSTPELLEIGGIPFVTAGEKPYRAEALKYYRAVAKKYELNVHTYEKVVRAEKGKEGFVVFTEGRGGREGRYETPHLVIATGYYDNPNRMNIPGEDLPKVHHYFREAHPYSDMDVLVVGGKNSAVEAALELHRAGARVTMAYRRDAFTKSVKAWVKPVIESAINKGWIRMLWKTEVKEICPDHVVLEQEGRRFTLPNDVVFAMTGYRPDVSMLRRLGVSIDPETGRSRSRSGDDGDQRLRPVHRRRDCRRT